MTCSKKNKEAIAFAIISFAYIASRFYMVEADLPVWNFAFYTALDEQYYTVQAFDWVFGKNFPGNEGDVIVFNLFQNFLTSLSLLAFGNNYYGLRIPSILCGFVILAIIYKITLDRFGNKYAFVISVFLLCESTFFLANIVAEPTIFRLAIASLLIYYIIYANEGKYFGLIIGVMSGLAVFFVYPSNFFIMPATLLWLVLSGSEQNVHAKLLLLSKALLGLLVALGCYLIYVWKFVNSDSIETIRRIVNLFAPQIHSIKSNEGAYGAVLGFEDKFFAIFNAAFFQNNFIFQLSIVMATVIFIASFGKTQFRKSDSVFFVFMAVFIMQLLFLNDYPNRKLVFLYPFLLYFSAFVVSNILIFGRYKGMHHTFSVVVALNLGVFSVVTYSQFLSKRNFSYMTAMKKLSYLNGERVVGGTSYAFRLYNDTKPYLNLYRYSYTDIVKYSDYVNSHTKLGYVKYSINYTDDKSKSEMLALGFVPDLLLHKSYDTPRYSDIYVYRFVSKPD